MKTTDPVTQPFVVSLMPPRNSDKTITRGAEQCIELRSGDQCPSCRSEYMDYDGLLNLTCPSCGYTLGGCFT